MPNIERSNMSVPRTNIKTTSTFKATVQRSITQSKNGKPPVTHSVKQTANAHFINGRLEDGNIDYEIRSNQTNADALHELRNQEKELEIMIKNYRIDDDDFVDAIDYVDNKYDDNKNIPEMNENSKMLKERTATTITNRKPLEPSPAGTPAKKTVSKSRYYVFFILICMIRIIKNAEGMFSQGFLPLQLPLIQYLPYISRA